MDDRCPGMRTPQLHSRRIATAGGHRGAVRVGADP